MFKDLMEGRKRSALLYRAFEDTDEMLQREERMFRVACDFLFLNKKPELDVVHQDEDIDTKERIIRMLVLEHLAMNPLQDLPASLVLISVVHDLERIGDYSKGLLEIGEVYAEEPRVGKYAQTCQEMRQMIAPLFGMTRQAFAESDLEMAKAVMERHREIKARSDRIVKALSKETGITANEAVVYTLGARGLRRISAHLSNITSSVTNPFDKIGFDMD